jgi:hypothetical protein
VTNRTRKENTAATKPTGIYGNTLDVDGVHRHLASYMVLDGPNPTGHAVWWFAEGTNYHTDYCFAPGGQG